MMDKQQVLDWVNTIPDGSSIAIDEGGLSLVEIDAEGDQTDAYLEIGLTPDEEDIASSEGPRDDDADSTQG